VGLVVVVSLALFYYGYNYLKGSKLFKSGYYIYAQYSNINGLGLDDPVMIRGFRVGKVSNTKLASQSGQILVEFHILDDELEIPNNSQAVIISSGLLGGKEINIEFGDSPNYMQPGDTITSGMEGDFLSSLSSSLEPFEQSAMDAVTSIDSVMILLQDVLDAKNRKAIDEGLEDLSETFQKLNNTSSELEEFITKEKTRLSIIITNLEQMSKNLNQFSDTLSDLELKKTMNEANVALAKVNTILSKIDSGEGSLGQLVNNDTLYQNLEDASKSLDKLLLDIEENPKRYVHFSVFGRKDKSKEKEQEKE
jgi:phospholipid/cholesterol/gamma-HCH transport system substrate-binding protein